MGIDNKIYVANGDKKQVLTYTPEGKAVEMTKKVPSVLPRRKGS